MLKTDKFNNYLNKMNNTEDLKIRSFPIKYNFPFLKQLKHNLQVILVQKSRLNLQVILVQKLKRNLQEVILLKNY